MCSSKSAVPIFAFALSIAMPSVEGSVHDGLSPKDLLTLYYSRLFPYSEFYKWLSYGGVRKNYFSNREFSFTLDGDVYIRYLSFSDHNELAREMQQKMPCKIDIGAVYSHKPKDHNAVQAAAFRAEEKELVFDIDMTDYDEVRYCCHGATICEKCWRLMVIAMRILNRALTEDFGFRHLLFVYSGRRGVHCWVGDEAARQLPTSARSAVAEYLSVVRGGESQAKKVQFHGQGLHGSLRHSEKIIDEYFQEVALDGQDILADGRYEKVLALVPNEDIRSMLGDRWKGKPSSSVQRWSDLEAAIASKPSKELVHTLREIKFQYTYPRLDVNVSKGINHLLKSPFSVHPKTGRVCVPIAIEDVNKFNPMEVPTVAQLCDEINQYDIDHKEGSQDGQDEKENPASGEASGKKKRKQPEWHKTSMEKPVAIFRNFIHGMEVSEKGKKQKLHEQGNTDW